MMNSYIYICIYIDIRYPKIIQYTSKHIMNNKNNRKRGTCTLFEEHNEGRLYPSTFQKKLHFFQDTVQSAGDPNLARLSLKMGATWALNPGKHKKGDRNENVKAG